MTKHSDSCLEGVTVYNRGCHAGYDECLSNVTDDLDELADAIATREGPLSRYHLVAVDIMRAKLRERRAARGKKTPG